MDYFEEIYDRLPENIKETDVLRFTTKKVLAALLELLLHSEARNSGIIFCPNKRLRKISGVGSNELITSLNQLQDYELITRKVGAGQGEASEYTVHLKKLKEPLLKKSFDDFFGEFMEGAKPSETPISTPTTTTTTITTTTPTSTTTTTPTTASTLSTSTTPIKTTIENNNNTYYTIQDFNDRYTKGYRNCKTKEEAKELYRTMKEECELYSYLLKTVEGENVVKELEDLYNWALSVKRTTEKINYTPTTETKTDSPTVDGDSDLTDWLDCLSEPYEPDSDERAYQELLRRVKSESV